MKRVNIVIPVHNRGELTKQTLDSLFQHTDTNLFRLYIIDDVSDEATRNMLVNYALDNPHIILIRNEENLGPAWSRNMMCDWITEHDQRYDYLYHSDNDVYFTERWLENLLEAIEDTEIRNMGIKLLGGGCHPYLQSSSFVYPNHLRMFKAGIKDAVSGYSQLMSWETWDQYGPFSDNNKHEDIKIMGSEDWAFCQKIVQDGFKVGSIEPEVVIACGKTNTYGQPATGSETFKEVEGVKIV